MGSRGEAKIIMFGFNKRIYERQLKRAVVINNAIMVGVFDHRINLLGHPINNPPRDSEIPEIRIISGAINYIFAKSIEAPIEEFNDKDKARALVYSKAQEILTSDSELERLILRVLFDIFSLCNILKKEEWAAKILSEYPRIMQVLKDGKEKYPETFKDYKEKEYRVLTEKFADKYAPEMKNSLLKLF